jgi:hypothetical protein
MNLVTIILIVILVWFLRSLLQSYKSLETQIRLVGLTCKADASAASASGAGDMSTSTPSPTVASTGASKGPLATMTYGLIGALSSLTAGI